MTQLFAAVFGEDFMSYETVKKTKVVQVSPESLPVFQYHHDSWEQGVAELTKRIAAARLTVPSETRPESVTPAVPATSSPVSDCRTPSVTDKPADPADR